jgi:hypothetical protein
MWNFTFFARRNITDVYSFLLLLLIFSQGWSYRPSDRRSLGEGSFDRKSNVLVPFLSDQKYWMADSPPPTLTFPRKSPDKNFEITIFFFKIIEKSNSYILEGDVIPHSPRGKGCKLWTLPIALYSIGYWKYIDVFRGIVLIEGERLRGRIFPWRNCWWG